MDIIKHNGVVRMPDVQRKGFCGSVRRVAGEEGMSDEVEDRMKECHYSHDCVHVCPCGVQWSSHDQQKEIARLRDELVQWEGARAHMEAKDRQIAKLRANLDRVLACHEEATGRCFDCRRLLNVTPILAHTELETLRRQNADLKAALRQAHSCATYNPDTDTCDGCFVSKALEGK